ncbi:threonine--tRNA ligase [candidate division WWE3 bacterium RIFCSPHIGHO2_01_FULL_42_13]|uniref:Threonine--tRNA ligase n=1 Tax=candidate division WWE3 bacterium RIFCSPHIGHO2_01_FULL_42_13 TaxID=1802617 RepID=A0A1F4URU6_UNCKA|nr:MAG: threonine--tRNA ligase [candidate division WWE3 bacterium RIFCSPHIGHO2_01_FULL_42_13]
MSKKKVIEQLKNDPLMPLRHSAEHVLHMAMQELYPSLKKVMGPPIKDGFYFDFDLDVAVSPEDFPKIEEKIQEIIDAKLPIKSMKSSLGDARAIFANNEYKLDTLDEIEKRGEEVTLYEVGEKGGEHYDLDLCAGPHLDNTADVKAFKLLSVAGAYYKGDEKNKMLQRIYGTAFDSKEALATYLEQIDLAKQRDHRKLGPELELFFLHETAPGSPYWLPKGMVVLNELISYWREEHAKRGYLETSTPLVNKKELFETSGHWQHYKADMFIADMGENEVYGIKPMNCPNAMIVFGSKSRSYRDLPLRLSDVDTLHRYERSGVLNGLLRVRSFRQDDSHNFISEDQIKAEYAEIFDIANQFYSVLGLEFRYRIGTRPEGFLGKVEAWNRAEKALYEILDETVGKGNYHVAEGDGAFYGPKVDILMDDSLGREWQMGTIQLDFQLPERFDLSYVDKDGQKKRPVVVHRVIYGSLERFIGILIEHFGGAFPVWLSPVQIEIVPISDKHLEYAQTVAQMAREQGLQAQVSDKDGSMGAKIRQAQLQKIPYMFVVGDKEIESGQVSVRLRNNEDLGAKATEEVLARIKEIKLTRSLSLW